MDGEKAQHHVSIGLLRISMLAKPPYGVEDSQSGDFDTFRTASLGNSVRLGLRESTRVCG